jgi:hypothetical protein
VRRLLAAQIDPIRVDLTVPIACWMLFRVLLIIEPEAGLCPTSQQLDAILEQAHLEQVFRRRAANRKRLRIGRVFQGNVPGSRDSVSLPIAGRMERPPRFLSRGECYILNTLLRNSGS